MVFVEELSFVFSSEKQAVVCCRAVSPELGNSFGKNTKIVMQTNKNVVLLKIIADNEKSFNALKRSYKRLFELCRRVTSI